jgi:hypothetical protein
LHAVNLSQRKVPGPRGRGTGRALVLASVLAALAGTAGASHLGGIDTEGHTTVDQTIVPIAAPGGGYTDLELGAGEPYIVRDGPHEANTSIPTAQAGRAQRRRSLVYVSQMTDFQLADEESPARVEFVDPGPSSAWRPQEGFTPFQIEATVRQINHYAAASPVAQGDGTRNAMDFALLTGDQADNQHLNETVWVRDLLEGNGPLNFNSGLSQAADYANPASLGSSCTAFVAQEGGAAGAAAEGAKYTGVQDYDDYPIGGPVTPLYYDPDQPQAPDWIDWPEYDGLMDRAQQIPVDPEGLDVPFYITNGNHDVLVQGNEDAIAALEDVATGCFKALGTRRSGSEPAALPGRRRDARAARPAPPVRLQAPDQADLRRIGRGRGRRRPRLCTRRSGGERGVRRSRVLLRLESEADARRPIHLDRHQLRGRPDRGDPPTGPAVDARVVERQPRRPAVPVAQA